MIVLSLLDLIVLRCGRWFSLFSFCVLVFFKGAFCSLAEEMFIKSESSSLADFCLRLDKLNNPTLFVFMTE